MEVVDMAIISGISAGFNEVRNCGSEDEALKARFQFAYDENALEVLC